MKPIIQSELDALRAQVAGLVNMVTSLTARVVTAEARLRELGDTPTFDAVYFTNTASDAERNSIRTHIDDPTGVVSGIPGDIIMDPANGVIWVCNSGTDWSAH